MSQHSRMETHAVGWNGDVIFGGIDRHFVMIQWIEALSGSFGSVPQIPFGIEQAGLFDESALVVANG